MPDLPEPPSENDEATSHQFDDDADNDTTLVISDDEVLSPDNQVSTLELESDDADKTDDAHSSSDSEIPTGYNSETGEVYQNQLADPILANKHSRQYR